jgi:hypothetical protein
MKEAWTGGKAEVSVESGEASDEPRFNEESMAVINSVKYQPRE